MSRFTDELQEADLIDLFEILPVEISDEELSDFGENDHILYQIEKELAIQFNTRKQLILKTIYAYILNMGKLSESNNFSLFGTNSFNLIWENVCAEVLDNKLYSTIDSLNLPTKSNFKFQTNDTLISLIEKPRWFGNISSGTVFEKIANDTLVPDIISLIKSENEYSFIIFDAKYYLLQLESDKKLMGQPGIGDITKQYLYQLSYKEFIEEYSIKNVHNCFLMPTEKKDIINKGFVSLNMMNSLNLQSIQIRLLPASEVFENYLTSNKLDISRLNL